MPLDFSNFSSLLYGEGDTGRYLRNNTKNTEATQQSQSACRVWESSCPFLPASILLVPGNAGLGLSRPGGPGTAPPWHLYCAQKLGHKAVVSLLLDLAKSVFYCHCLQVSKAQVTDDK